jgi:rhodanese-related sulfurtransferase
MVLHRLKGKLEVYRQGIREALLITAAATVLAFGYTFLTEKGFFAPARIADSTRKEPAPTLIDLNESRILFESGKALFIDSRHFFDFKRGHIRAAFNIPLTEMDSMQTAIASLPRDKTLIVYCDGVECNSSIELASKLHARGIGGVRIFFGGWQEWTNQKLPTEVSQ